MGHNKKPWELVLLLHCLWWSRGPAHKQLMVEEYGSYLMVLHWEVSSLALKVDMLSIAAPPLPRN